MEPDFDKIIDDLVSKYPKADEFYSNSLEDAVKRYEAICKEQDGECEDETSAKNDDEYSIVKNGDTYEIHKGEEPLKTPGGRIVKTLYLPIAEQLLTDLKEEGYYSYTSPDSLLSFHFTTMDYVAQMPKDVFINQLNSMNWEKSWTLQGCPTGNPQLMMPWMAYFGERNRRIEQIRQWLKNQTPMQLGATVCVYNAFMDFNVPFCWAFFVECVPEAEQESAIEDFFKFYYKFDNTFNSPYFFAIFKRFSLYYGVHFKEMGVHLPLNKKQD